METWFEGDSHRHPKPPVHRMVFASVISSLVALLIGRLPLWGVFLWAWIQSRRIGEPAQAQSAVLRAALLAVVFIDVAFHLTVEALPNWFSPLGPLALSVAIVTVSFVSNIAYAVCWYFVLRLVLDFATLRPPRAQFEEQIHEGKQTRSRETVSRPHTVRIFAGVIGFAVAGALIVHPIAFAVTIAFGAIFQPMHPAGGPTREYGWNRGLPAFGLSISGAILGVIAFLIVYCVIMRWKAGNKRTAAVNSPESV